MESDWRQLFLGRDAELAYLLGAWQRAKAGRPRFVVLLAESGLGKTRLVQELYRHLSRHEDARPGYWPDAFENRQQSLDVNPSFAPAGGADARAAAARPEIPWLWWGMRWTKPDLRNRSDSGCALIDHVDALRPHIEPILLARQRRALRNDALAKLGQTIAGATPGLGFFAALKDVTEFVALWRQEQDLRQQLQQGVAAREAERRRGAADLALDAFRTVLDPRRVDARHVPCVLVLDDAQWADPTTLEFVERLAVESRAGGWPCLVVATHWEREWYEHLLPGDRPAAPDPPRHLADLVHRLGPGRVEQYTLGKVPDLSGMLAAALPGLTGAQRELIAATADGNPQHLIEVVHYLLSNPPLFAGRDVRGPLTRRAEQRLPGETLDYHRLLQKRFDALGDRVKDVLGWSSYQGVRFLREVTREAAARLQPPGASPDVEAALRAAEKPHAFVQHFETNLSEFRSNAFHEVARRYLDLDEANVEALRAVVRETLAAWVRDGRIWHLPPAERIDALLIATRELWPADAAGDTPDAGPATTADASDPLDPSLAVWGRATSMLHAAYREQGLSDQARAAARRLADLRPPEGGWPFEAFGAWAQVAAIHTLTEFRDLDAARDLARDLTARARDRAAADGARDALRELAASVDALANVEEAAGRVHAALEGFREALGITRRLLSERGPTAETLADLALSLDRVGDAEASAGGLGRAVEARRESLAVRRRLVSEHGPTPEALSGLAASLLGLGKAESVAGRAGAAMSAYQECLGIRRRVVSEAGETSEALGDLFVALLRVGAAEADAGRREPAMGAYREALGVARRLLAEYGPTPQALARVSLALGDVGDLEALAGRHERAAEAHGEALALDRRLVAEFGRTPAALAALVRSLHRAGDAEARAGRPERAMRAYREGLEAGRRGLAEYAPTPGVLATVSLSLVKVGDAELDAGRAGPALEVYAESLEIRRRALAEHGPTRAALEDVLASLARVGDVARTTGRWDVAAQAYGEALALARRVLSEYGETPDALQSLSALLERVGLAEAAAERPGPAMEAHREGLAIARRLRSLHGPTPVAVRGLAASLFRVGSLARAAGRADEACAAYREARELFQQVLDLSGPTAGAAADLAAVTDAMREAGCEP